MAVALHVCLKRTRATRASQHRQHMCTSVPQNHTTCVFCCVSRKHACWLVRLDLRVAVRLHTRGRMSVCVCTREGDPRLTELGSCFSRTFSTVTKSSSGERERERERERVCVCVCERERDSVCVCVCLPEILVFVIDFFPEKKISSKFLRKFLKKSITKTRIPGRPLFQKGLFSGNNSHKSNIKHFKRIIYSLI